MKLSTEELVILKNINDNYKLIERDKVGRLYLYVLDEEDFIEEYRPYYGDLPRCLYFPYGNMFKMITECQYHPMLISDVIDKFGT
jgi:hypothetical protein